MQGLLIKGVRPEADERPAHGARQDVHAGLLSPAAWGRRLPALAALALLVAVGVLARTGLSEPVMAQAAHPVATVGAAAAR